jgi:hypothetical protein
LNARGGRWTGAWIVLLAAAVATVPVFLRRPYCGDDYQFHLISWLDALQSWRHGIPYPHWTPNANYGAGEPRFVFYPPLVWMLGAALGTALPWSWIPVALTFLLLAATGLATLALARQLLPSAPATLAACAAVLSGYALFSAYERSAFPELSGGFWIPLLLLFALRESDASATFWRRVLDGSAAPLALVVAGCWLSDLPLGVMASYTLAGVALSVAVVSRSWVPVARAAIAAVLGLALAGLYLIPAIWEQRWVDVGQATGAVGDQGLLIENNWLFPRGSSAAFNVHYAEAHVASLVTASMIAVALASLLVFWLRRRPLVEPRRWWIPLALIPVVVLFLQFPISLPVWNLLPKLRFLQFPWRWLLVLEAPMGIFFAAAVWPRKSARRGLRAAVAGACCVCLLASLVLAARTLFRACLPEDSLPRLLASFHSGAGFWGADEYAPPGADNSMVATGLPDACLAASFNTDLGVPPAPDYNPVWRADQGGCTPIAAELRQPERLHIAAVASHAGVLILRLRSYPAWRITMNGRPAINLPVRVDGLIAVPVAQGPFDLDVDWSATPDVMVGRGVSILAVVLLVALRRRERYGVVPGHT